MVAPLTTLKSLFAATISYPSATGSMLVIPCAPFHANTFHMLRSVDCHDLHLANGYSGHSTPAFDRLMSLEKEQGRASPAQLEAAWALGVDRVSVVKGGTHPRTIARGRAGHPVWFENERVLVVDKPHAPNGDY